jgi:hypothetical protein
MFETQTILEKMTENDIYLDEYSPAKSTITSLSQLTKEQFHDLMSSDHPAAKNYRDYAKKEFEYRVKTYQSLNDFFNHNSNT